MQKPNGKLFALLLLYVLLQCGVNSVGALPLAGDPNAILSDAGDYSFGGLANQPILDVRLEYAVYEADYYRLAGGYDPSWQGPGTGDDYIYAYQMFNSSGSGVGADFMSVGILDGAQVGAIGYDPNFGGGGGVAPTVGLFVGNPAQSAVYLFSNCVVGGNGTDEESVILLFTSNQGPIMGHGTVAGGGVGGTVAVSRPSAIPEPATLVIFATGIAITFVTRRRAG